MDAIIILRGCCQFPSRPITFGTPVAGSALGRARNIDVRVGTGDRIPRHTSVRLHLTTLC
ncbi:hypothetical protein E2C01_073824 [Portunus trituberculatus]|uniref:Uncharacterized protein n=1 Tax=Portunus trituberculatus TaxID=210409 RepID=A0A5B7IAH9_PORTR|nr:hypothetical protein [Portunus trituberculatus]